MLKQVKLKVITEDNYYNQISQTSEIHWSFLNRVKGDKWSFQELFLKVKCREYLGDLVVCGNLDIDVPMIYGMSLRKKRISIKETLLSVSLYQESVPTFIKNMKYLRRIEKSMGIPMTRIYSTQHQGAFDTRLVLIGDKKWVSSPLLISIYSLIIRAMTYSLRGNSFKSHIKALVISSWSYGNDAQAFKTIDRNGVDLIHLLQNIDKVISDNPLTGLNDENLRADKRLLTAEYQNVVLNYEGHSHSWCMSNNHSQHGIINFVDGVNYTNSRGHRKNYGINSSWVNNYIQLIKDEKELISNPVVQPIPAYSLEW
jgi:hypothetical protein